MFRAVSELVSGHWEAEFGCKILQGIASYIFCKNLNVIF